MTAQFEQLWNTLVKADLFELPAEMKPLLLDSMKSAGYIATDEPTGPKVKKYNGHTLFVKEKTIEFKAEKGADGKYKDAISELWKGLSDDEKAQWKAKAIELNKSAGPVAPKTKKSKKDVSEKKEKKPKKDGPSKKHGWTMFFEEKMATSDKSVVAKERMKLIAGEWKILTQESKDVYNAKAKAINAVNFPEKPAEPVA